MSNKGELSDKEWASVFEVGDQQCYPLSSAVAQILLELVPCAVTQVCGGNAGALMTTSRLWKTWTMSRQVGHSCWLCMMPGAVFQCTNSIIHLCHSSAGGVAPPHEKDAGRVQGRPRLGHRRVLLCGVCCLAEAPYGAVVLDTLHAKLGKATVRALVKANLLAYRPSLHCRVSKGHTY